MYNRKKSTNSRVEVKVVKMKTGTRVETEHQHLIVKIRYQRTKQKIETIKEIYHWSNGKIKQFKQAAATINVTCSREMKTNDNLNELITKLKMITSKKEIYIKNVRDRRNTWQGQECRGN